MGSYGHLVKSRFRGAQLWNRLCEIGLTLFWPLAFQTAYSLLVDIFYNKGYVSSETALGISSRSFTCEAVTLQRVLCDFKIPIIDPRGDRAA